MRKNQFKFTSYLDQIEKDLAKAEKKQIRRVTSVVKRKIRSNIKAMGLVDKGNLLKGVKDDIYEHAALIGVAAPGFHALLVEYGHKAPNGRIVKGRPFMLPAFRSSSSKVQKMLQEEWI